MGNCPSREIFDTMKLLNKGGISQDQKNIIKLASTSTPNNMYQRKKSQGGVSSPLFGNATLTFTFSHNNFCLLGPLSPPPLTLSYKFPLLPCTAPCNSFQYFLHSYLSWNLGTPKLSYKSKYLHPQQTITPSLLDCDTGNVLTILYTTFYSSLISNST